MPNTLKTVNRRKLLNAALKGKLVAKCTGSYTDDYLYDAANNFGIMTEFRRVVIKKDGEKFADVQAKNPDTIVWNNWYFTSRSGRAYYSQGVITLYVHSNLTYTVRIEP